MKNGAGKGFTILELLVGFVVLAILASLAVAGYQGYRDRAAMLVDETNQKVLVAAVKLYAYDNNALPGSLSRLRPQDLERAYAQVTEGKRPYTVFAYLQECVGLSVAEAEMLPPKYYNQDTQVLTCPSDPTPPATGGKSYEMVAGTANQPLSWLLDPANESQDLIEESDGAGPAYRHGGNSICVVTKVRGDNSRKKLSRGSTETPAPRPNQLPMEERDGERES